MRRRFATNMLPHRCSHKHCSYKHALTNPRTCSRNRILQYYCSMHTLSPKHKSRHTFSYKHTEQITHSPTYIQSKATSSYIHTGQSILSPTYIQSKATFSSIYTEQRIPSITNVLRWACAWRRVASHKHSHTTRAPRACCHKHIGQDIPLPRNTCYQRYSLRHTFNYEHLPANTWLPYTILFHGHRFPKRNGHQRTYEHRHHNTTTCHSRQDNQPRNSQLLASE